MYLAAQVAQYHVVLRNSSTHEVQHTCSGCTSGKVACLAFSKDEKKLAAAFMNSPAVVWEIDTDTIIATIDKSNEGNHVRRISFDSSGSRLLVRRKGGRVSIWDMDIEETIVTFDTFASNLAFPCACFTVDESMILTNSATSSTAATAIVVWDAYSGAELMKLNGHASSVRDIAVSPDGFTIATASTDKSVIIWDLPTASKKFQCWGHHASIGYVRYFREGTLLASGSNDKSITVWNTANGDVVLRIECDDIVDSMSINSSGTRIACGYFSQGHISVYDADTGAAVGGKIPSISECCVCYSAPASILLRSIKPEGYVHGGGGKPTVKSLPKTLESGVEYLVKCIRRQIYPC
jgi:WD40 repeat protein